MTLNSRPVSCGAIILCRLDSTRLPGKVLRPVNGKPIIWYVITRLRQLPFLKNHMVVATTIRMVDDPINDYCNSQKVQVFRGSADDVSDRVLKCAKQYGWDYFFRINADSPFIDDQLLKKGHELSYKGYDIITNLYPRSFPYGVSLELIRTDTYNLIYQRMNKIEHFEHVTKYFYEDMHQYNYFNITRKGENLSNIRLTIDTEEDMMTFSSFISSSSKPWQEINYTDALSHYLTYPNN